VNVKPQVAKLRQGVDIVVACPGRLLDHLNQGNLDLSHLETLVLDEADHMFDMGFLPDIRRIIKYVPKKRQTLLFSATMPDSIKGLAQEVLQDPATIQVDTAAPARTVSHALYPVEPHLKTAMLLELLQLTKTESVLVFTRTKYRAKRLGEKLAKSGYRAASLQGNLSQNKRQAALNGFRDGSFQILVATDIAARGIDVRQISHVINYDIPDTTNAYIHRIGRTGRAAKSGAAYTLVSGEDRIMIRAIEQVLGSPLERRTVDGFDYSPARPARTPSSPGRPGNPCRAANRPGRVKQNLFTRIRRATSRRVQPRPAKQAKIIPAVPVCGTAGVRPHRASICRPAGVAVRNAEAARTPAPPSVPAITACPERWI